MTEHKAHQIYEILIKECGADPHNEDNFVFAINHPCSTEYSFYGSLGTGGKFYHTMSRWWVSCYSDDCTPVRAELVARANHELMLLKATMDDPLNSIARFLHKYYSKRYKGRYVEIEPEERREGSRLCIMFRHANHPYPSYLRISFKSDIVLERRVKEERAHVNWKERWEECGRVVYDDPKMQRKLNRLVARIVETTPRIETITKIGEKSVS